METVEVQLKMRTVELSETEVDCICSAMASYLSDRTVHGEGGE